MNILAIFCVLAVSASAQIVGPSGIVRPDGNNVQFTQEQADNYVLVGPSGIVTKDGKNIQLTADSLPVEQAVPAMPLHVVTPQDATRAEQQGLVGPSGIVHPEGNIQFTKEQADNRNVDTILPVSNSNVPAQTHKSQIKFEQGDQLIFLDGFTQEQVDNFAFVGPSGIVAKDGNNIQFRSRRSAEISRLVGPSGIVDVNGNTQFTIEQAEKFSIDGSLPQANNLKINIPEDSIIGASGIVSPNGNIQFTIEQAEKYNKDKSLPQVNTLKIEIPEGSIVGASGIVSPNGNTQFTLEQAQQFNQESSNAQNIKDVTSVPIFTAPVPAAVSAPAPANSERLVGPSGIVDPSGNIQFTQEQVDNMQTTHNVVSPASSTPNLLSPVLSSLQRSSDNHNQEKNFIVKGSIIEFKQGDNTVILDGFTQEQVDNFVYIGPSGIVTKDGQNIQLRSRRSAEFTRLVGPSGIVDVNGNTQFTIEQAEEFNKDGSLPQAKSVKIEIPEGSIVGASGIVSPNENIQFTLEQAQEFNQESPNTEKIINVAVPSISTFSDPASANSERLVGPSGIVDPSGNIQFSQEQVDNMQTTHNVVSPASSTPNLLPPMLSALQRSSDKHNQEKNFIVKGSVIEFKQGDKTVILDGFTQEQVDNFVYIGPSGIVTKDGQNIQLV